MFSTFLSLYHRFYQWQVFSMVNDTGDMYLLHARNSIHRRESLLAKVELLGIRHILNAHKASLKLGSERQDVCLKPVRNRVGELMQQ